MRRTRGEIVDEAGVDHERASKIESYEPEGLSMVADSTSEPEAGCGGRRRGFKWKLRPIRRNRRHGYRRLRPDVPHKRRAAPLHTYNHPLSCI